jgi:Fe-S-cluster containining protein
MNMNLENRLAVLEQLYQVYEKFIGVHEVACGKGCSLCCTRNVTLTTLEGYYIVKHLGPDGQAAVFHGLRKYAARDRLRPRLTINAMAECCARGLDVADEPGDPGWGSCPVLDGDLCPLYRIRPFGCRAMISRQNCHDTGYADMPDLVLTANNVMLQTIEHIDAKGFSGNFTDVLLFLAESQNRRAYAAGQLGPPGEGLLANRPLTVLMIPPEHRAAIRPLIRAIQALRGATVPEDKISADG